MSFTAKHICEKTGVFTALTGARPLWSRSAELQSRYKITIPLTACWRIILL